MLLCALGACMLNHDQSPTPRTQGSLQATPPAHEEERFVIDPGPRHPPSRQDPISFYRIGCGSEAGRKNPRCLELISDSNPRQVSKDYCGIPAFARAALLVARQAEPARRCGT